MVDVRRCQCTNKVKRQILEDVTARQASGESLKSICRGHQIQPSQLRNWQKQMNNIKKSRSSAVSAHAGRKSCLFEIEEDIIQWIFELRQQGLAVSVRMVQLKTAEMLPAFQHRSERSKDQAIRRFLKSHRLVIRVSTHESQCAPHEVIEEALDFVRITRP